MSAKLLRFEKKPPDTQNGTGEAFCLNCLHEWVAVAPTGTIELECPKCKTMKGLYKFPFHPPEGTYMRECNCGNQLFYLTTEGHMCANCGVYQCY
jgi:phage FluMu protein Com